MDPTAQQGISTGGRAEPIGDSVRFQREQLSGPRTTLLTFGSHGRWARAPPARRDPPCPPHTHPATLPAEEGKAGMDGARGGPSPGLAEAARGELGVEEPHSRSADSASRRPALPRASRRRV
jgi:hypothetical protein